MKTLPRQHKDWILAVTILLCAPFSSRAAITIDTSNSADWSCRGLVRILMAS